MASIQWATSVQEKLIDLIKGALAASMLFVLFTISAQDARADTWVQGGHGCAGCEVCTSSSCMCREHSCSDYGEFKANPNHKLLDKAVKTPARKTKEK